jgi:hypothetical protein
MSRVAIEVLWRVAIEALVELQLERCRVAIHLIKIIKKIHVQNCNWRAWEVAIEVFAMLQLECLLSDFYTKMPIHWLPIFVWKNFKSRCFWYSRKKMKILMQSHSGETKQIKCVLQKPWEHHLHIKNVLADPTGCRKKRNKKTNHLDL